MHSLSTQLESIIDQHLPTLQAMSENEFAFKPSPAKWSKKEILGHLIDSAQNNIRRFIVAQYEDEPKIVYNQDRWVAITGYQQWDSARIIQLWYSLNKQVCQIWRNMPTEMYRRNCLTQSLHSIEWLAEDYIKHLLHHLHVILKLEPVAYP
jgi:DinB superfamily